MLPRGLSGREIIRALRHVGWQHVRTRGSHAIMIHDEVPVTVAVPLHDDIGRGLLRKIISDAGMTVEEFLKYL